MSKTSVKGKDVIRDSKIPRNEIRQKEAKHLHRVSELRKE